jgi:N6-adenosine-specific RNA methylase IME4
LARAERDQLSVRELRSIAARMTADAATADAPTPITGWVADLETLIARGDRFGCIYADPPWAYDNQTTRAATDDHYDTMAIEAIAALPVDQLAAADAHLHLWVTNAFLFDAPRLFDAWGFEFKSSFVWCKPQIGIGNYWRNAHEILLTAVRGDAKHFRDHNLPSWLEHRRGRHSAKPERIRDMLEKASPGPRLEMFARRPAKGWTVWGNQIVSDLASPEAKEISHE